MPDAKLVDGWAVVIWAPIAARWKCIVKCESFERASYIGQVLELAEVANVRCVRCRICDAENSIFVVEDLEPLESGGIGFEDPADDASLYS